MSPCFYISDNGNIISNDTDNDINYNIGYENNVDENNNNSNDIENKSKYGVNPGGNTNVNINNSLKVLYVNARSLLNNFQVQELEIYAAEHDLDVIGICETWITGEINNAEIAIENYTVFKIDRDSIKDKRGGGVLLCEE